ncbi:hypothetical protein [Burkholderia cenocepacia]|uniref:hypothetical protein n=1 Tax=Burkholderia cenocepacia TaxID=95486 RepID=UPI001FB5DE75|nr:hypothetical protein [Burkholderia cenocepacia]MDR5647621.1 hypothetical protein [Burkholderia cenocepacia]
MEGKFKVGDRVLIARKVDRDDTGYWSPSMDKYVGTLGTIARSTPDSFGRYSVQADAGGPPFFYHPDALRLNGQEFDLFAAMTGKPLKFRSGCDVKFIAYSPDARPHCQLVLLNPSTGNIVTRYANGKASDEPHSDPGDILVKEAA